MFIQPPNLSSPKIRAFFTTKKLSDNTKSFQQALSGELNIPESSIYMPVQKHTSAIHTLESNHEPVVADAVITARGNVLIGVIVADCVPVLLFDKRERIIGAVHAGWRGTAAGILINTVDAMKSKFNCMPEDILVAIGPSIRQCSYEVNEEVMDAVRKTTGAGLYYKIEADKHFIDLSTANRVQALNTGILEENIWQSEECTFCSPEKYYSYRYSKGIAGRQGGFIGMW